MKIAIACATALLLSGASVYAREFRQDAARLGSVTERSGCQLREPKCGTGY